MPSGDDRASGVAAMRQAQQFIDVIVANHRRKFAVQRSAGGIGRHLSAFNLRLLHSSKQLLECALLCFKRIAKRMIVGVMDLMRQICEDSFEDLNEQSSFIVVKGQGVHFDRPCR